MSANMQAKAANAGGTRRAPAETAERLLQRKCTSCGTGSSGGKCEGCEAKKRKKAQAKLRVGDAGDSMEREADRAADAVMMGSSSGSIGRAPPVVLRKAGDYENNAGIAAPAIIDDVLASSGTPLDAGARSYLEPRFGHDFSKVRVHADAVAARSASEMGALAYTVGQDIVFATGQYRPDDASGRHLLSHELAHTVQQGNDGALVQRSCAKAPCPLITNPLSALYPLYDAAEKCIQTQYMATHPASKQGVSLSFNAEWQHLTGASPRQKAALSCLRGDETPGAGPNYTAKHGMYAAAPDMWDFNNGTMYEITTPSGAGLRGPKLAAEVVLANKLCSPADCGGMAFDVGGWAPDPGCYALGGDLYFSAQNINGVIIYEILQDITKETAAATALVLAAAALTALSKTAAKTAAKQIGGKLVPAYAIARMMAAVALLASGKAYAKPGPGDDSLVEMLKAMEKNGTPVPPEIQKMLDDDPALKERLNKALSEGADPTKLQEELNKEILDTIAKNKDQFTDEEIEILLAGSKAVGKALPKGNMTVEELKKAAAAAKARKGKPAGDDKGTRGGDGPALPPPAPPPAGKTDDKTTDKKPDNAGDATVKVEPLSTGTKERLVKATAPVKQLFTSMLGKGDKAKKLSDAHVKRFLDMVPPDLTAEDVEKLMKNLKTIADEDADKALDALQAALDQLKSPPASGTTPALPPASPGTTPAPPVPTPDKPRDDASLTTEPTDRGMTKDPNVLIAELAAKAKDMNFAGLGKGDYHISWKRKANETVGVGTIINGSLRGRRPTDGAGYVGRVEAEVKSIDPMDARKLNILYITATPMVTAKKEIAFAASHFVGNQRTVTLDPPPPKKKK